MINKIESGIYDSSLLQCFYLHLRNNNTIVCNNSLSGESFNYCTRKFIKNR